MHVTRSLAGAAIVLISVNAKLALVATHVAARS